MPLTQVPQSMLSSDLQAATYAFKNRIINGAMVIDQRNAGASVNITSAGGSFFTVDRFFVFNSNTATLTAQRSTVVPSGFANSLLVTVTGTSAGSSQTAIYQRIEGFNCADLGFGSANAQTVTLSFWVRSSVTGTYNCALRNNAQNRSYVSTYTINAANTWEQKTITIAGDQSGTWATDNSTGIEVTFSLGTSSSQTINTWGNGSIASSGTTNLTATNGATFYITGVQLEKGSTATSFDYRPYGTELQLCQRYLPAFNSTGTTATVCSAFANSSTKARATFPFPVSARSAATGVTVSAGSHFTFTGTTTVAGTSVAFHTGSATAASFDLDGVSGLTAGQGGLIYCTNSTGYLLFTGCEL